MTKTIICQNILRWMPVFEKKNEPKAKFLGNFGRFCPLISVDHVVNGSEPLRYLRIF